MTKTARFKVGDKVKNIYGTTVPDDKSVFEDHIWKDKVYTIQAYNLVSYDCASISFVEFNNDPQWRDYNWWIESHFVLVQSASEIKTDIDYLQLAKDVSSHV